jgi:hypothetical protein
MTDRELLELAAKAAGMWPGDFELDDDMQPVLPDGKGFRLAWGRGWWNPLTDDGDRYQLARTCGLIVDFDGCEVRWYVEGEEVPRRLSWFKDDLHGEALAITRAAAIGGLSSDPSKQRS